MGTTETRNIHGEFVRKGRYPLPCRRRISSRSCQPLRGTASYQPCTVYIFDGRWVPRNGTAPAPRNVSPQSQLPIPFFDKQPKGQLSKTNCPHKGCIRSLLVQSQREEVVRHTPDHDSPRAARYPLRRPKRAATGSLGYPAGARCEG